MHRFIYNTTCRDCLSPDLCNGEGRCESCDGDRRDDALRAEAAIARFDAYTAENALAANRAYFARRNRAA
jgi:hypothetical protein